MVLIPVKDTNPLVRIDFPYVTIGIIALCVVVFLWQLGLGPAQGRLFYGLGIIPAVITGQRELSDDLILVPAELTLVTSMFLHGGWLHLGGNMLFLWIFGDNVEDAMGHVRYLLFYLLTGVVAAIGHVAADPGSTIPTIGASGAVSGVLGAYLVLHPRAQILMLFLRFFVPLPAWVVLSAWMALQVSSVYFGNADPEGGGVAWWAHIGGFVAGAILVFVFRRRGVAVFDRGAPPLPPRELIARLKRGSVPVTRRRRF